ncbi:MAG: hypothetical protein ACK6C0_13080 [Betaproteobacteria bacterium]
MKRKQIVGGIAALVAACYAGAQTPGVVTRVHPGDPDPVPGAKPVAVQAIDTLRGEGLYSILGSRVVNLRVGDKLVDNRYPVTETATDAAGSFNAHLDVAHFLRDGERRALGRPNFAAPGEGGAMTLIYQSATPLRVSVTMQGYDVSGLAIRDFLRTADSTADSTVDSNAAKVGEAKFPAGSMAYLATVSFADDVLVLPRRESFTGAANVKQMVANFSKDIPFCLSYEERGGATPYAMRFHPGGTSGKVSLYIAKLGTVFCAPGEDLVRAEGTWDEKTVGGTRAIVLSFPANVDPLDTGVSPAERDAALVAFIEPTKGAPGVRPGKMYRAGARVADHKYRFNATAAQAIRSAAGI